MTYSIKTDLETQEKLKNLILAEYGDAADRIVVIGSSVDGNFRDGISDIDVVVMTNKSLDQGFYDVIAFDDRLDNELKGPWKKISLATKASKHVHQVGTNYPGCFEGSVLNGFVIFNNGAQYIGEIMTADEAREYVVDQYLSQSWNFVQFAVPSSTSAAYSACRSACRALHAVLASRDVGFVPKELRWNLRTLNCVAEGLYSNLDVKRLTEQLPAELAFFDIDDAPFEDNYRTSDRRKMMAIAMRVIRACELVLGKKTNRFVRARARTLKKHKQDDFE